ncbi:MAG: VOC family protein [Saprospiraceae bacterium]
MNLNQVTIPSKDLSQAVPFYERLGLRLIVSALPRYARFECPEGASTFSIHHVDQLPTGSGIILYFECEDLDQRVASLQATGFQFEELPNDKSWLWREARLKDLDGNQLILYFAGDNRKNPPWRIK